MGCVYAIRVVWSKLDPGADAPFCVLSHVYQEVVVVFYP